MALWARVGDNITCPHCGHAQVVSEQRHTIRNVDFDVCRDRDHKYHYTSNFFLLCSNSSCRRLTVSIKYYSYESYSGGRFVGSVLQKEIQLVPPSTAIILPEYIPSPIRQDYEEACLIRELSPKASATLIRRCLQGMIRDFCQISIKDNRLVAEIRELRRLVDEGKAPPDVQADTIDAIDRVREIGNIGAHMEKDINVIIDVDENEAEILIKLCELLFEEWYISREKRRMKINRVLAVGSQKNALRSNNSVGPPHTAKEAE